MSAAQHVDVFDILPELYAPFLHAGQMLHRWTFTVGVNLQTLCAFAHASIRVESLTQWF